MTFQAVSFIRQQQPVSSPYRWSSWSRPLACRSGRDSGRTLRAATFHGWLWAKANVAADEAGFASWALEAVLAAARRPPGNEDSLADGASRGGLTRSFVTF